MNARAKCGACAHWKHNTEMRVGANIASPGGGAMLTEVRVGSCHESPPITLIVPIRTMQGDGMAPQPFRPLVLDSDQACSRFEAELKS